MAKDYYSILGVQKSASQDEIKKAFRNLAHEHHPDKSGGNESKFKEINEAYQVLGNKEKRAQYDQFGTTFDSAGMAGGGGFGGQGFNWQDFARQYGGAQGFSARGESAYGGNFGQDEFRTNINFEDMGDIFGDIGDLFGFGTTRNRSRSRAQVSGEDISVEMIIDFREAVFGAEKMIELNKLERCEKCQGKGYEAGTKIITCPECHGRGQTQETRRTFFGAFSTMSVCRTCQGEGKKPESFCAKCHGTGRIKNKKEIKIKIPAGISEGETIRIEGEGSAGAKSSPAGDLYLSFHIRPDRELERDGYNILSQVEISMVQATLGDKILINTVDGQVELKIPAGTQPGTIFALKNKGVPFLNNPSRRGEHLVTVIVKIPEKLSRRQRQLLEEMEL